MMLRRFFGTIHYGHLDPSEFASIDDYFRDHIEVFDWYGSGLTAAAFALEEGTKTQRRHIQVYAEHSRKRPSTLARLFQVSAEEVFRTVIDAAGSWAYCTGTGAHAEKHAFARCQFGDPKLHGDSTKADLRMMVGLLLDGAKLTDLVKAHPYAWCVHRKRLIELDLDLRAIKRTGDIWKGQRD